MHQQRTGGVLRRVGVELGPDQVALARVRVDHDDGLVLVVRACEVGLGHEPRAVERGRVVEAGHLGHHDLAGREAVGGVVGLGVDRDAVLVARHLAGLQRQSAPGGRVVVALGEVVVGEGQQAGGRVDRVTAHGRAGGRAPRRRGRAGRARRRGQRSDAWLRTLHRRPVGADRIRSARGVRVAAGRSGLAGRGPAGRRRHAGRGDRLVAARSRRRDAGRRQRAHRGHGHRRLRRGRARRGGRRRAGRRAAARGHLRHQRRAGRRRRAHVRRHGARLRARADRPRARRCARSPRRSTRSGPWRWRRCSTAPAPGRSWR